MSRAADQDSPVEPGGGGSQGSPDAGVEQNTPQEHTQPQENQPSDAQQAEAAQTSLNQGESHTGEPQADDGSGTPPPNWVTSQLPKDMQDEPLLKQYSKPADALRAFVELSRKQEQGLTHPGDDATEEQMRQFREALGVPKGPDGYELDTGDNEPDEDMLSWFKQAAHKASLSPQQAQKVMEEWNASLTPEAQQQRLAKQRENVENQLRQEWGGDFDENIRMAHKAMDTFAGEEFSSYLEETGAGNDPRMVKTFAEIGRRMTGDSFVSGSAGGEQQETENDKLRRMFPTMFAEWEQQGKL